MVSDSLICKSDGPALKHNILLLTIHEDEDLRQAVSNCKEKE